MSTSKQRIFEAAERVVLRDGGAHLTLEAVAAEAAMSKGGLLYHFPSKEDLVRGMIVQLQEEFKAETDRLAAQDPIPEGRFTRAYVNATLAPENSEFGLRVGQISAALLAAVATNLSLLQPVHEQERGIRAALAADGIDPVLANIARLAADGLWMAGLFGLPLLNAGLRAGVIEKLNEFTRPV